MKKYTINNYLRKWQFTPANANPSFALDTTIIDMLAEHPSTIVNSNSIISIPQSRPFQSTIKKNEFPLRKYRNCIFKLCTISLYRSKSFDWWTRLQRCHPSLGVWWKSRRNPNWNANTSSSIFSELLRAASMGFSSMSFYGKLTFYSLKWLLIMWL